MAPFQKGGAGISGSGVLAVSGLQVSSRTAERFAFRVRGVEARRSNAYGVELWRCIAHPKKSFSVMPQLG